MAVRADDIALGDLGKDAFGARPSDHSSDSDDFLAGIAMVEVHRLSDEETFRRRDR
jgi:hypothetical protein